jgi:hypothetical protein
MSPQKIPTAQSAFSVNQLCMPAIVTRTFLLVANPFSFRLVLTRRDAPAK